MHSSDDDDKQAGKTGRSNGINGANGHDHEAEDKVVHFPTLADRDRIRKEKAEQEKAWQKQYKAQKKAEKVPFFNMPNIPPFVRFIVPAMIIIYVIQGLILNETQNYWLMYNLGFVPANFTVHFQPLALITPLTYMFLHGDWTHALINAFMLAALGTAFERVFGTVRSVQFFIATGLLGALLQFIFTPFMPGPVIGASGAISGYFASFLLVAHYRGAMPIRGKMAKYGIWPLVGLWLFLIVGLGILLGGPQIAWQAHLGGFIGGVLITSYWARGTLKFWK